MDDKDDQQDLIIERQSNWWANFGLGLLGGLTVVLAVMLFLQLFT